MAARFSKGRPEAQMMPPGREWRTGADVATIITTDKPLKFGAVSLAPGTYTINTVPGEKEWQIVFGRLSKPGQWGIPYQKDLEIGRTAMAIGKTKAPVENVTISIDDTPTRRNAAGRMGHGLGDGAVYGRVTEESKEQRAESREHELGWLRSLLSPFAFCLLPFAFALPLALDGISPGAHHLPHYLPLDRQRELADRLRGLIDGAVPAYVPVVRGGGKMHVRMLCLGRHWNAKTYQYEPVRSDFDAQPAPPLPADLQQLAREIAAAAGMTIDPDLCIVNYYAADGKMGLHQDKDEGPASIAAGIPVVSLSVGDTARFLFGGLKRRDPIDVVALESGDAFVFGGPARLRYHGVSRITPGTAPAELQMDGRFNLTFRQSDATCRASS